MTFLTQDLLSQESIQDEDGGGGMVIRTEGTGDVDADNNDEDCVHDEHAIIPLIDKNWIRFRTSQCQVMSASCTRLACPMQYRA